MSAAERVREAREALWSLLPLALRAFWGERLTQRTDALIAAVRAETLADVREAVEEAIFHALAKPPRHGNRGTCQTCYEHHDNCTCRDTDIHNTAIAEVLATLTTLEAK